jgi:hypothetical protein
VSVPERREVRSGFFRERRSSRNRTEKRKSARMARAAGGRSGRSPWQRNTNSYQARHRLAMKGAAEIPMGTPQVCWTRAGPNRMKVESGRMAKRVLNAGRVKVRVMVSRTRW